MAWITNLFWNAEHHRLRALWRLLIWAIVWLTLLLISQAIIVAIAVAMAYAAGGLTPQQLTDPQAIDEYTARQIWVMPALQIAELVVTVGTVWLAGRFLDRRRFTDFGLQISRDWWIDFGFGLFLGAILMTLIFGIEMATGWATITGSFVAPQPGVFALAILLVLLSFVMVGISEELFSRGYLLTNMAEGFNWKITGPHWAIVIATLLSSAVFGVLHATNPHATPISTFNIFLAGIFLALGYLLTGKLAIPIGLHITWNFFEGNVFGFPVSGNPANVTTFIAIRQGGPAFWTGGAFGPEAGLIGIMAMVLGSLLMILWVYWRYGSVGLHQALAEAPAPAAQAASDTDSVSTAGSIDTLNVN